MAAGFRTADGRNAGSFADGFTRVFDYPAEVLGEATEKAAELREEDYQLAYAIDILKGLSALGDSDD